MTPSEAALAAKLNAVNAVARRHLWPDWFRCLCLDRMAAGHKLHGADASTVPCAREALEELADAGNYGAIGRMQGRWSRGWSLVAWLVGIGARLVRREAEKEVEKGQPAPPVLHDLCACGLLEWHEHDAGDADWFGPSGWFRRWPTDPAPDFCCVCGTRVGPGNVAYPSPLYKGDPDPAPEGGPE